MPAGLEPRELDLRDYLRVLRRRRGIILVTVLLVVGLAVAYSLHQTKSYQATAQVLVRPASTQSGTGASDQATELLLMQAQDVKDAATKKLGHPPDVSLAPVGTTSVIQITAKSPHPKQAAADANAYAQAAVAVREKAAVDAIVASEHDLQAKIDQVNSQSQQLDLQLAAASPFDRAAVAATQSSQRSRLAAELTSNSTQLDQLQTAASAETTRREIVANATVPTSPVSPKPLRNALIALVVGLVLGIALAFVREFLKDTITTKEDVERVSGVPVVGIIPTARGWKNRKKPMLVTMTSPNSRAAEAYRTLRTSLQFLSIDQPIKALQVTSTQAVDGKTTTVANLAVAAARAGQLVVVACCDLRRPRVHEFFGLSNQVGLSSVLRGEVQLVDALQSVDGEPGLLVLASGPPAPNPAELLASARTAAVIRSLRERSDLLILDSTPVLPVSDALVVSGLVDATLIVTTAGVTTKRGLRRTVELLSQVEAPLVGAVMSFPTNRSGFGYASGYTYGYGSGYGGHSSHPARNGEGGRKAKKAGAAG